jgi:hypothetical protein
MYFKRNESFRFSLDDPIPAFVKITYRKEDSIRESNGGETVIYDISQRGLKIRSSEDFPFPSNDSSLDIRFTLENLTITLVGNIVWKKQIGSRFLYGFFSEEDPQTERVIISTLKSYAKNHQKTRK